jgi:hypothetical protein
MKERTYEQYVALGDAVLSQARELQKRRDKRNGPKDVRRVIDALKVKGFRVRQTAKGEWKVTRK